MSIYVAVCVCLSVSVFVPVYYQNKQENNLNLTKYLVIPCVGAPGNIIWVNIFVTLFFMILLIKPCQFGARKHDNTVALYKFLKHIISFEYASW